MLAWGRGTGWSALAVTEANPLRVGLSLNSYRRNLYVHAGAEESNADPSF